VVVGHLMVAGSEVSSGQTIMGTTVELSPADLMDLGASYVALGHVHKAQEWFGGRVAYSGSPHRCNYGEPEAKGWRLVTLEDDGTFVSNEFRELPARRIVRLEADWTGHLEAGFVGPALLEHGEDLREALVRFRYRIGAEALFLVPEPEIVKILRDQGAHEVKIEAVVEASVRSRAPELATVTTIREKVVGYLKAKGVEVPAGRLEEVLTKADAVEREVSQ
jgi:exonuclease SbcD